MTPHHLTAASLAVGVGEATSRPKRSPLAFTKRDVTRAIEGHMAAGLSVQRTEIDRTGRISIVTGQPEETSIALENEWDSIR
jgi:hypothetical protein